MANYNTFALVNTKTKKIRLVTSSARRSKREFEKGYRIEVWSANSLAEVIYSRNISDIDKYIKIEKEYIARKQRKAEAKNKQRKRKWLNG